MAYFLFQKFKGIRERENSPGHVAHQTTNNNQQRLSAQNIELARYENLDGIEPGHHAQILSPIQTHDKLHRKDNSEDLNKAANIYRWKLILGLLLPFSVQALDLTIIAPAVYFIASDFSQYPREFASASSILTNLDRPASPFKLDTLSLQPLQCRVHSSLGSISRYVWSLHHPSSGLSYHPPWCDSLRDSSYRCIPNAVDRTSSPRGRLCRSFDPYQDHTCRQGYPEGDCTQQYGLQLC